MSRENTIVLGDGFLATAFKMAGYSNFKFDLHRDGQTMVDQIDLYHNKCRNLPACIVNCIAKTNVKECNEIGHMHETFDVNTYFPIALAAFCEKNGIHLIHISTGCVYGSATDAQEHDATYPKGFYEQSKVVADVQLLSKFKNVTVLRPRLLYGGFSHPKNLFDRLSSFSSFYNEENSVTSVEHVIDTVERLALNELAFKHIFNVGSDCMSMFNIARIMGKEAQMIKGISPYPKVKMASDKLLNFIEYSKEEPQIWWCNYPSIKTDENFSIKNIWKKYQKSVNQ